MAILILAVTYNKKSSRCHGAPTRVGKSVNTLSVRKEFQLFTSDLKHGIIFFNSFHLDAKQCEKWQVMPRPACVQTSSQGTLDFLFSHFSSPDHLARWATHTDVLNHLNVFTEHPSLFASYLDAWNIINSVSEYEQNFPCPNNCINKAKPHPKPATIKVRLEILFQHKLLSLGVTNSNVFRCGH